LDPNSTRALAIELFNTTWTHMDAGDPLMIRTAYASQHHWSQVGGVVEEQRGEWLISRVWCLQGEGSVAVRHARQAWEIGESAGWDAGVGFAPFDQPFALEALARSAACAGDVATARDYRTQAEAAGKLIDDVEEREYFLSDLAGGNWFDL
jgi:hypothetical protein